MNVSSIFSEEPERGYLTPSEIDARQPAPPPASSEAALDESRGRMIATHQWTPNQFLGRRWPIGCVALEITQRCNLDCTACYLSDHSEAVKDLPLDEVWRRIDMILEHYGPHTDVQVTGGDPTLRKRHELIEIVRRIRHRGMRPALVTNGIRARRDLLQDLANAGLVDVAFHVDMTQQRKGYHSERALNALRQEYIERARGLGLSVIFNTTVFDGNVDEIPDVVAFFVRNSDIVRLASFQIQAETGRGILGRCDPRITMTSVRRQIESGAGSPLSFDTARIGHARCNRYAMTVVINGKVYDVLDDPALFDQMLEQTAHLQFDRQNRTAAVRTLVKGVLNNPQLTRRGLLWLSRKLWRAKGDLLAARGRVNKLSFFVHHFMDSCRLEKDRIDACSFTVVTHSGPISMCLHNARRDSFILQPIKLHRQEGERFWNPLSGQASDAASEVVIPVAALGKRAKGRLKQASPTTGRSSR